jgi:hypothetical protein
MSDPVRPRRRTSLATPHAGSTVSGLAKLAFAALLVVIAAGGPGKALAAEELGAASPPAAEPHLPPASGVVLPPRHGTGGKAELPNATSKNGPTGVKECRPGVICVGKGLAYEEISAAAAIAPPFRNR